MMKIHYDTQAALEETEKIMRVIRDESYRTSVALAREKGAFPLFQWDGYSKSKFIAALPADIQESIKTHGIRNSTVITVPPVGTGSIVAQTSSGHRADFLHKLPSTREEPRRRDVLRVQSVPSACEEVIQR